MSGSNVTCTYTTSVNHQLSNGSQVTTTGFSPSAYNVQGATITVVNATVFSITLPLGYNDFGIIQSISGSTVVVSIESGTNLPDGMGALTNNNPSTFLSARMFVTGAGITLGTYILPTTTSGTWTLSRPATANVTGPLTFSVPSKFRISGPGIPAGTFVRTVSQYQTSMVLTLVDLYGTPVNATKANTTAPYVTCFDGDNINVEECVFRNTGMMAMEWLDQTSIPIAALRNVKINRCVFDGTGVSGVPGNGQAISIGYGENINITNNDFRKGLMSIEFFMANSTIANNVFGETPPYHSRMAIDAIFIGDGSLGGSGASPYGSGFVTYASLSAPTGTPMANGRTSTGQFYPGYAFIVVGSYTSAYVSYQSPVVNVDQTITINSVVYAYAITLKNSSTTVGTTPITADMYLYSPCAAGNPIGSTPSGCGLQKGNRILGNVSSDKSPYPICIFGEQDLLMEGNKWSFTSQPVKWASNPGGNVSLINVRGMLAANEQYITDSAHESIIVYLRGGTQVGSDGIATIRSTNHRFANCLFNATGSTVPSLDLQGNVETVSFTGCTFAPFANPISLITAGSTTQYTVSTVNGLKIGMNVTISGATSSVASCNGSGAITAISGFIVTVGINSSGATGIVTTNATMTYNAKPWSTTISAVSAGSNTQYTVGTKEGITAGMTVTVSGCVQAGSSTGFNGTGTVVSINASVVTVSIASVGSATFSNAVMVIVRPVNAACNEVKLRKTQLATANCSVWLGSNVLNYTYPETTGTVLGGYLVTGTGIPENTYICFSNGPNAGAHEIYLMDCRCEPVFATATSTGTYTFYDAANVSTDISVI